MATFEILTTANTIGGGGGGSLLSATVTLTDAQIKALPSEAVELVAAQGAGKAIIPVSCIAISNFTAGAYTDITGASWQLGIGNGFATIGSPFWAELALGASTFLSQISCVDYLTGSGDFAGVSVTYPALPPSDYDNSALYLADAFGGVSDYTGGNAANTLTVITQYVVVDL